VSKPTDDWCTPAWLAKLLGRFDLDPCSNARSHINAQRYCRLDNDNPLFRNGLTYDWRDDSVYANPPYSNVMPWAQQLAAHSAAWVALVKLDPTTKWWSTLMTATPQIAPFRKRIKFEGPLDMTANFASVLIYKNWEPSAELAKHLWVFEQSGNAVTSRPKSQPVIYVDGQRRST
jgi:hypothetical protein